LPVFLEYAIALGTIVVAASLFTNAIEILGGRLSLGQGVVGSVLAAVGTALPAMIPVVAILAAVFAGRAPVAAPPLSSPNLPVWWCQATLRRAGRREQGPSRP
jgi:hypothetical protein